MLGAGADLEVLTKSVRLSSSIHYGAFKNEDLSSMRIVPLGDLHIGAPSSRYSAVLNYIERALEDDSTYFILLGDLLDNALKDSLGDIYEEASNPSESMKLLGRLLDLMEGRVLGVVEGNHEARTTKRVGISVLGILCEQRGIPFSEGVLALDVVIGRKNKERGYSFKVVVGHGNGGGRTSGSKVNAALRLAEVINNADIYLTGHTHESSWVKKSVYEFDDHNKSLSQKVRHHVTVPSWLGYELYAAKMFLPPSVTSSVCINLSGECGKKCIEVQLI